MREAQNHLNYLLKNALTIFGNVILIRTTNTKLISFWFVFKFLFFSRKPLPFFRRQMSDLLQAIKPKENTQKPKCCLLFEAYFFQLIGDTFSHFVSLWKVTSCPNELSIHPLFWEKEGFENIGSSTCRVNAMA